MLKFGITNLKNILNAKPLYVIKIWSVEGNNSLRDATLEGIYTEFSAGMFYSPIVRYIKCGYKLKIHGTWISSTSRLYKYM